MNTNFHGKTLIVALGLAAAVSQGTESRGEEVSADVGVVVESASYALETSSTSPVPAFALPTSVQVIPASSTSVGNCIPFGNNTSYEFTGFIYRNVPAFSLPVGAR